MQEIDKARVIQANYLSHIILVKHITIWYQWYTNIFSPDTNICYHMVRTDRRTSYVSLFISHIHTCLCFGAQHLFIWELFLFFFKQFIGLRAALSSKATLSLLTTDRIWTGPSTSTSLWCSLGHDGAGKSGCCEFVRLPLSLRRWLLVAGVRPDAFGFHLGPNGGNLGLCIILFIRLIISLALWACLHSNPGDFWCNTTIMNP